MTSPSSRPVGADPTRGIELLWGQVPAPGRTGLTVEAVVEAATALADASGLGEVSMRKVAESLGVGAMSLYTYVPGRAELVDLMVDAAHRRLYSGPDDLAGWPSWDAAMREVAERSWRLLTRHPWILGVSTTRPVLGPGTMVKYEAELRPLDGIGLTDLEMDAVLTLVLTHTHGAARAQADLDRAARESGASEAQWWEQVAPTLERFMEDQDFPVSARVGQAAGEEFNAAAAPRQAFEFGLERILTGVQDLLDGRAH